MMELLFEIDNEIYSVDISTTINDSFSSYKFVERVK